MAASFYLITIGIYRIITLKVEDSLVNLTLFQNLEVLSGNFKSGILKNWEVRFKNYPRFGYSRKM